MSAPDQHARLTAALQQAARDLTDRHQDGADPWQQAAQQLTHAAVSTIPGVASAGLTLREPDGSLGSHAPTDPSIVQLDQLQTQLGQGPCVDALHADGQALVTVEDFSTETRWPDFTPAAAQAGIASLLSATVSPEAGAAGAMNLYGSGPGVFDPETRHIAAAFATQATVALASAEHAAGLREALSSRDVIGQAKGILLERFRLTDQQQAFDLLVRSSQDTHIKLADVARWLVTDTTSRSHHGPRSNHRRDGHRSGPSGVGPDQVVTGPGPGCGSDPPGSTR